MLIYFLCGVIYCGVLWLVQDNTRMLGVRGRRWDNIHNPIRSRSLRSQGLEVGDTLLNCVAQVKLRSNLFTSAFMHE